MNGGHKRRFTNYILVVKHEDTIEYLSNKHLYFSELALEKYYILCTKPVKQNHRRFPSPLEIWALSAVSSFSLNKLFNSLIIFLFRKATKDVLYVCLFESILYITFFEKDNFASAELYLACFCSVNLIFHCLLVPVILYEKPVFLHYCYLGNCESFCVSFLFWFSVVFWLRCVTILVIINLIYLILEVLASLDFFFNWSLAYMACPYFYFLGYSRLEVVQHGIRSKTIPKDIFCLLLWRQLYCNLISFTPTSFSSSLFS